MNRDNDDHYILWMQKFRKYYVVKNTLFVNVGVDEEAEDEWEWGIDDFTFIEKISYPGWEVLYEHCRRPCRISRDLWVTHFHDIYFKRRKYLLHR